MQKKWSKTRFLPKIQKPLQTWFFDEKRAMCLRKTMRKANF